VELLRPWLRERERVKGVLDQIFWLCGVCRECAAAEERGTYGRRERSGGICNSLIIVTIQLMLSLSNHVMM